MRTRVVFTLALGVASALAQTAPAPAAKPEPDLLTLSDGEKLIGHFVRASGDHVIFHSDVLGDLTIAWANVKELHSAQRYVVVSKDTKLDHRVEANKLPRGTISEADQTLLIEPTPNAPAQKIPVADAAHVLDEATFQKVVFHNPGFFQDWKGAVTAGASIVQATQQSRTFTGAVSLIRATPAEDWLAPRNRTIVDFSASDGFEIQPATPKIKTEIVHADAERDQYFRGKSLYGFGQVAFDHNYSQGLDLQSNVGGGLGYTVIQKANETLDFKGSITYVRQNFQARESDTSLLGSNFIETFTHKTAHGILFLESITITPTWTVLEDYSGAATGSVSIPVFKRIGFTTAISDNFLNNPPPGFKKNSFQLTTGLTYTLK